MRTLPSEAPVKVAYNPQFTPWLNICQFVFQSLRHVRLFVTPWSSAHQAFLSSTIKLIHSEWVMPSNHLRLHHSLLSLPSVCTSNRVFSNEQAVHVRWPKYWSISFSISPCKEYSGLVSFEIDWFDLLAVQETLKSLLQHNNLKASVLQRSPFFVAQF